MGRSSRRKHLRREAEIYVQANILYDAIDAIVSFLRWGAA